MSDQPSTHESVEFCLEPADIRALSARGSLIPNYPTAVLLTLAVVLIMSAFTMKGGFHHLSVQRLPTKELLSAAVPIGLFLVFVLFYWRSTFSRAALERATPGVFSSRSLTLTPEGIIHEDRTGRSLAYWSAIERIHETRRHVFVFVSRHAAIVIPKRIFPTELACASFVGTIQRHMERK